MEINIYGLRIHYDPTKAEEYEKLEAKYFDVYLRCLEKSDTPQAHYHYYIETSKNKGAIREHLNKYIGKGNKWFSFIPQSKIEYRSLTYLGYMQKEGLDKVKNVGLPQSLLDEAYKVELQTQSEYKERVEKKKEEAEMKKWQIIMSKYLEYVQEFNMLPPKEKLRRGFPEIESFVVDYYIENKYVINTSTIANTCLTIKVHIDEDSRDQYKQSIKRQVREMIARKT